MQEFVFIYGLVIPGQAVGTHQVAQGTRAIGGSLQTKIQPTSLCSCSPLFLESFSPPPPLTHLSRLSLGLPPTTQLLSEISAWFSGNLDQVHPVPVTPFGLVSRTGMDFPRTVKDHSRGTGRKFRISICKL